MSKTRLVVNYALAYVMWVLSLVLLLWFIFLSREAIAGLLTMFYLNGSLNRTKMFQFINQWYFYFMGLFWLILMIVAEHYFRQGVVKGDLLRRVSRIIGPELLLLFITNLARSFIITFTFLDWLVAVVELILGVVLLWWAAKSKPPIQGILARKANT